MRLEVIGEQSFVRCSVKEKEKRGPKKTTVTESLAKEIATHQPSADAFFGDKPKKEAAVQ